MKPLLLAACAALAFAAPAQAQHDGHSAHMPAEQPASAPEADPHAGHVMSAPAPAQADPHAGHSGHAPDAPAPAAAPPDAPAADPHAGHAAEEPYDGFYPAMSHPGGALGYYTRRRDAGATAWQPDASLHGGIHAETGGWSLMGHALLNGVYGRQSGPRGDDMAFVSGMAMGQARRRVGPVWWQATVMLSPDALMGRRGYPLHLASGETADGETALVDRQHPHDLFMELSTSVSAYVDERIHVFAYAGLPGAPAFGPPAFMHRQSAMDSPEAPISHHWLDSTHISFGVLTVGIVRDEIKLEASRFNGREPDQHRYNIETGPLDSTAARISWNPTRELSLQASWAHLVSPEQLEPGENQTRWSASAIYTRDLGDGDWWSTTLAWGRSAEHGSLDAFVLESAAGLGPWTLFARAEHAENNELIPAEGHHGPALDVAKLSAGVIRDVRVADHVLLGVGGLYALNFVPDELEQGYGGDPTGGMLFVRLKID